MRRRASTSLTSRYKQASSILGIEKPFLSAGLRRGKERAHGSQLFECSFQNVKRPKDHKMYICLRRG